MFNESVISKANLEWTAWSDDRWACRVWAKLSCALFGHKVNNFVFAGIRGQARHCRCGIRYLDPDQETRVAHTVSCFLFGHNYVRIDQRDGHHEYVCNPCGHPLLFTTEHDPYADHAKFMKKVRYRCNLFGHRVHHVTTRNGLNEYACNCGHSFLKDEPGKSVVKHPPICLFAGHYLQFTERRGAYDEYRWRNCGHTFCFVVAQ